MLLRRCGILRGCLYDSRNGIKNKMGDFFPAFICRFFQPARVDLMGWFLFRLLNVESSRWLENFSCCRKLNKTNFPHSMFRFNSTLLLFINLRTLWNQKHECSRKYITHKKSSHADFFWQFASLKLLRVFWICCCHVSGVLTKTTLKEVTFSDFFRLLQWIHVRVFKYVR